LSRDYAALLQQAIFVCESSQLAVLMQREEWEQRLIAAAANGGGGS
jgi:hypothetical protein